MEFITPKFGFVENMNFTLLVYFPQTRDIVLKSEYEIKCHLFLVYIFNIHLFLYIEKKEKKR